VIRRFHVSACVGLVLTSIVGCTTPAGRPDVQDDAANATDATGDRATNPPDVAPCPDDAAVDDVPTPAIHTPRWAFEPWISKDISDTADTYAFVRGFRDRDIPVGTVVLDSPWETNYNTFVPDTVRYPNFAQLVRDMHADNVRVVLWITQMINRVSFDGEPGGTIYDGPSPNFELAQRCGFFVNHGALYTWWKGQGGGLDFFNARAAAWWHRQQDGVLDLGIDGWKLDFGESYVRTPTIQTAVGTMPHQRYSEEYYRDFLAYGVSRRGRENFLTMVRPWDESYGFAGRFHARREHAPVAWVGDQRRDWIGIVDALDETFRSARAGYAMLGSDVGGYLDFNDLDPLGPRIPFDTAVLARWTPIGALMPFMQLHGRANITPWTVPDHVDETVRLYRYWSKLHHELVPFLYSITEHAWRGEGPTPIEPIGDPSAWAGDYRYVLGRAFLVAPIVDASGRRDVPLPSDARWYDWWNPGAAFLDGGQTLRAVDATDRARIPLYVREGAIIPAHVSDDITGLGNTASAGRLTLVLYPGRTMTSLDLIDDDERPSRIDTVATAAGAHVTVARSVRAMVMRIRTESAPTRIVVNGVAATQFVTRATLDAATSGWLDERANRWTWVRLPAGTADVVVE